MIGLLILKGGTLLGHLKYFDIWQIYYWSLKYQTLFTVSMFVVQYYQEVILLDPPPQKKEEDNK